MSFPSSPIPAIPADAPESIGQARDLLGAAIARARSMTLSDQTIVAALLVELVPRLVGVLGHSRAAAMLCGLADEVRNEDRGAHVHHRGAHVHH